VSRHRPAPKEMKLSDLTDDEIEIACTASDHRLQRAAIEVKRHRAAVRANRERVRAAVREAAEEYRKSQFPFQQSTDALVDAIATRVADALASPVPALTAERVRSVVREAIEIGMPWKPDARDARIWDSIADRAAERLAGSECEHCKDGWPTRKCVVSGDIIHRGPEFSSRCTAQPPSETAPPVRPKRTREELVRLIGENAADNYLSFDQPTGHDDAVRGLVLSDDDIDVLRRMRKSIQYSGEFSALMDKLIAHRKAP